ncbi:hypothetical protein SARC_08335 [Sphaeroforma arctica JP610]|uniref:Uncharacterized protein n=1 Tax=Sphaeroforma arctica JP610 TaxID=667725 RepID=A0A0L0FR24_9EUKA|nr:hypothetical protein SARC_08335 [Sphaeroforma arctica JP610]KNC79262.1 hypothetical protein SARC_08335 [Sphaeroforma arctica JP610]|eukprot:XP_014153164.1 hypothetical protein SARC_08335 [Sphaeroforma arctica JP610]
MSTITMTHLQTGDMEFDQDSEMESQVIVQNMYEIEEEFSQLKNLKYKQKLEQIENDIGLLEAGTLDVYVQKVAQLQKDKEATDKVAEISRDYRLQSIAHMVAFEKRTCENEYKLTRKKLYKARVNKLESRKRKLEEEHTQNAAIEAEIIAHNRRVGKQKLEKKNKGPSKWI